MKNIYFLILFFLPVLFSGCHHKPVDDKGLSTTPGAATLPAADNSRIIAARIHIQPGKISEFIELFRGMTEKTLTEPGCTGYQLYQNPYAPEEFLVFESYRNQAAIEAHFAAGYFKEYGDKIGQLTSRPSEIRIIDVAGEEIR